MPEESKCPNCKEAIEAGAAFCGNCGFKLVGGQPDYSEIHQQDIQNGNLAANTSSHPHHKQHWAAMALVLGIIGLLGGVLIPIFAVGFGLAGMIISTSSYSITRGWLRPSGLIASILAVLLGIGLWINAVRNDPQLHSVNSQNTSYQVTRQDVNTPCYSFSINKLLNVNNDRGSCNLTAYDGTTLANSDNVYIVSLTISPPSNSNFSDYSQSAVANDLQVNFPHYGATSRGDILFDSEPAYYILARDSTNHTSVIDEIVQNNSLNNPKYYLISYKTNSQNVNLNDIEFNWQWR